MHHVIGDHIIERVRTRIGNLDKEETTLGKLASQIFQRGKRLGKMFQTVHHGYDRKWARHLGNRTRIKGLESRNQLKRRQASVVEFQPKKLPFPFTSECLKRPARCASDV